MLKLFEKQQSFTKEVNKGEINFDPLGI